VLGASFGGDSSFPLERLDEDEEGDRHGVCLSSNHADLLLAIALPLPPQILTIRKGQARRKSCINYAPIRSPPWNNIAPLLVLAVGSERLAGPQK
jgi:hypothetical protein